MSVYNKKENKGKKPNDTPTPLHLCNYLYNLIKDKYDKPDITILDCCAGDKRLTNNFKNCNIINYEIKEGTNFLKETNKIDCDLCIFNPPFNAGGGKKLSVEVFLDKILELCNNGIGIIMITPMGFRLNVRKTSKRRINFKNNKYPEITSIISLPLDTFENTLFHCEILIFNINNLKPHYFY
jgi:type I restriction enzyme M protein